MPSHRYPTRYSADQAFEIAELGKHTYGDLEGRVRTIEGRMERTSREVERLQADATRTDELAPKINALSVSLENFKTAQLKINHGIIQEIIRFKTLYSETIAPKLQDQSQEIALLTAKYNMLQAIAASLISGRLSAAADQKIPVPPSYQSYPNVPSSQARRISTV